MFFISQFIVTGTQECIGQIRFQLKPYCWIIFPHPVCEKSVPVVFAVGVSRFPPPDCHSLPQNVCPAFVNIARPPNSKAVVIPFASRNLLLRGKTVRRRLRGKSCHPMVLNDPDNGEDAENKHLRSWETRFGACKRVARDASVGVRRGTWAMNAALARGSGISPTAKTIPLIEPPSSGEQQVPGWPAAGFPYKPIVG
jgi:hypothetical protein